MKRHELTDLRDTIKSSSGWTARTALLAYAFLRGLPYRRCEPVTADRGESGNTFFVACLARDIAAAVPVRLQDATTGKAAVAQWLAVPEEPHTREARVKRTRDAQERDTQRRAAYRAQVMAARRGAA